MCTNFRCLHLCPEYIQTFTRITWIYFLSWCSTFKFWKLYAFTNTVNWGKLKKYRVNQIQYFGGQCWSNKPTNNCSNDWTDCRHSWSYNGTKCQSNSSYDGRSNRRSSNNSAHHTCPAVDNIFDATLPRYFIFPPLFHIRPSLVTQENGQ